MLRSLLKAYILDFAARGLGFRQGVTKRCRLSWLTNSALVLVYEPKCNEHS
jgi:hypothetical protein